MKLNRKHSSVGKERERKLKTLVNLKYLCVYQKHATDKQDLVKARHYTSVYAEADGRGVSELGFVREDII